jgi:AraC-like DNA-binding protein
LYEFTASRLDAACSTDGMEVTTIRPGARLAPHVDRFVIVESPVEATRVLLPEAGLVLGVRYAGASSVIDGERVTRLADIVLTGVLGAARTMRTHAGGGIVLAMFRPTGAARFFKAPLHELFGSTVGLDALVARAEVERLGNVLTAARDHAGRVAVLEGFLTARLDDDGGDPIATAAVRAIEAARGSLRIASLADGLGISQDPLEKRFRRAVGASPKQLAQLCRIKHAIGLGQRGATWSRVAHEAGYADQSHFNREFRAVTGSSPTRFFGGVEHC